MRYKIINESRVPKPDRIKGLQGYLSKEQIILKKFKDREIQPYPKYNLLIKNYVQKIKNMYNYIILKSIGLFAIVFTLLTGLISIFEGFPFKNISIMGIVIQQGWIFSKPELYTLDLLLSVLLVAVLYYAILHNDIKKLNNLLLKDCDADTYLQVAQYGITSKNNKRTEKIFNNMYVTALCVNDRDRDALEFVKSLDDKGCLDIIVHLNMANTKEIYDKYYDKLKVKGNFKLKKLYLDQDYEGLVEFVRTNINRDSTYESLLGDLYLAKSYYNTEEYKKAFLFASRCVAEGGNLPKIYKESLAIYEDLMCRLSQK